MPESKNRPKRPTGFAEPGSSGNGERVRSRLPPSMRAAIMGVTVKETSRDRSVAQTTVRPNWRKNWPTMSVMNAIGAKTTTSHSVMATAASAISCRPFTAAARGSSPRAMWRSMFSRMTMESSTRIPMHSPSAMRETTFSVKWNAHIAKKVPTRDTGMAMSTMREDRHRRRNRKSTSDVVMMLSTRFRRVSARDEVMNTVASLAIVRDVPGGRVRPRAASSAFTTLAVVTTFASLCLRTKMPIVGRVFRRTDVTGSG